MGIYPAEERQRQLETGSYLAGSAEDEVPEAESLKASVPVDPDPAERPAPVEAHTSTELLEAVTGNAVDAPLCFTCGTKMRTAGSCHVCEGCGSTRGCS